MLDHTFKCGLVALIGPANAGKSSLLNAYIGQKVAIVTPKPQTTRNRISGILTDDETQVVFFDTPGIHKKRGAMNRFLLQSALNALTGADAIVLVLDSSMYIQKPHLLDKDLSLLKSHVLKANRPILIAANKTDLIRDKKTLLPFFERLQEFFPDAELFPISCRSEDGLEPLLAKIKSLLPLSPPLYPEDQISTAPLRFMASEIVREKLFLNLRQELPYSTTVIIESWDEESQPGKVRINALIYLARKSHKSIVIGKGGRNLKQIGTDARQEIQELLEMPVHLELWVKVKESWTENEPFLRSIGLSE